MTRNDGGPISGRYHSRVAIHSRPHASALTPHALSNFDEPRSATLPMCYLVELITCEAQI